MSAALAPGQDDFLSLLKPSLSDGFQEDSSLFSFEAKNPEAERSLSNDYSQVIVFISSLNGASLFRFAWDVTITGWIKDQMHACSRVKGGPL